MIRLTFHDEEAEAVEKEIWAAYTGPHVPIIVSLAGKDRHYTIKQLIPSSEGGAIQLTVVCEEI